MSRLMGTYAADNLVGTTDADFVSAGGGDDLIRTFALANLSLGETDARMAIADANDTVWAGSGNDQILAGGGNDVIYADYGNDIIDAGVGNDRMFGMQGADTFRFKWEMTSPSLEDVSGGTGAGNRDFIGDFRQGEDLIDISGWQNAVDGIMGCEFNYWGVLTHGSVNEATYRHEAGNTIVMVGFEDKVTEIELAGTHWLNEGDFIFA